MRKIPLGVVAIAIALPGGMLGSRAAAMSIAAPSLRGAISGILPIQQVRNVCGLNGCAPVMVKRLQKPVRKITATPAPLVASGAPAPAAAPAASAKPWPLSLLHW